MIRALYTSGLGMTTQMNRMDVVSNNIANVNTTGYKKDLAVKRSFDDALAKRTKDIEDKKFPSITKNVGDITYGVYVDEIYTDFTQGNLIKTNGEYDIAIAGDGFFTVNVTDRSGNTQVKYTRDGSFTTDYDGYLLTKDGGRVQGLNGDIILPGGVLTIEQNGQIFVEGEYVDSLNMADFEDLKTLRKQADNYLVTTAGTVDKPFTGSVIQGALEASNVNTVKEMVDLITVNRIYEANSRIVQTIDQSLQKSAADVGRK